MAPHSPLVVPLSPRDPERIGPHLLLGRLGAGAMGRVYLGRSTAGRLVAVKVIRPELAVEADFRTGFAREVAAARRVSGAFTAAVVSADPDADTPWLATVYVPAPPLDEVVRRCGPLPVSAVRWLAAGCAEALQSIHDAGLVHRDLKPSNVLVAPDGPRVIDFGVARARRAEKLELTATGAAVGTPSYMAPEQARDARRAKAASDVFSLGSTLVYAATGHGPYGGETVLDILVRLATEPPDLGGLPDDLHDLVAACLDRDPARRPSPAELLTHLAPAMAGPAPHPQTSSWLPDPAVELIGRFQHIPGSVPRPVVAEAVVAEADEERPAGWGDDATTVASLAPAPTVEAQPAAGPSGRTRPRWRSGLTSWPGGRTGSRLGPLRSRRGGRIAAVVVSAVATVGLVYLGSLLGPSLSGRTTAGAVGGAPSHDDGRPIPPGLPPAPLSGASDRPTGDPRITVNQPFGDGNTLFVIHGTGWPPGQHVTVALVGRPASPDTPVVDDTGTFNYAVNQAHEFFAGPLPPGVYDVTVTGPQGAEATATFRVRPGGEAN